MPDDDARRPDTTLVLLPAPVLDYHGGVPAGRPAGSRCVNGGGLMTRRTLRRLSVFLAIVAVLVTAEVALNHWQGSAGCVEVVNEGQEPIEDLILTCGAHREGVSKIPAGAAARIYLGSHGSESLVVKFRQRGNVIGTYEVPGFNADDLRRDGFKLVLKVRPGEVERYQDDDEPTSPVALLVNRAWKGISNSLNDVDDPD